MSTGYAFEIPDEVADAGVEGYVRSGSGRPRIESLKGGETVICYFVTDPDEGTAQGDWINYREVSAFQGFKGGLEAPNGLKEFPVIDQEIVEVDGKKVRRFRRNNDGSPADWLLDQVAPPTKFKTKSGKAEGRDKTIFNIVDSEGVHKLVKVSGTVGKAIRKQVKTIAAINKGFTLLNQPWKLTIVGTGATQDVSLSPIDESYPEDLRPEKPIDAREVLQKIRDDAEAYYKNALSEGTDTFDDEDDAGWTVAEPAAEADVTPVETAAAEVEVEPEVVDVWKDVKPAQIKEALTTAGVEFPDNATKSALTRLAGANNINPTDFDD